MHIKVPKRNFVGRHCRMVHDKGCNVFCMFQKLLVLGVFIAHGITIKSPCLSAGPCRFVGQSLVCFTLQYLTGQRVIADHMIRAVIFSEVVFHGGYRMCFSGIKPFRFIEFVAGPV
ncbi:hypothetical protein D3C87_1864940 [compost metagenome]